MITVLLTFFIILGYLLIGFLWVLFLRCGDRDVWPNSGYTSEEEYSIVLYLWPVWLVITTFYWAFLPIGRLLSCLPELVNDAADKLCDTLKRHVRRTDK